ncbi:sensor histidine kinase, partial [bacterium]|nr:sensor histidine kinase [bacterium]
MIESGFFETEQTIQLHSNEKRNYVWRIIEQLDENQSINEFIVFGDDVTEHFEREILEASSREQRKIGREIHDSICQSLTGIYCLNETLSSNQENPASPDAQLIERMKKHLKDVTVQSRNIARSLYLHELEHNGLQNALEEFTKKIENLYQIKCRMDCPENVPSFNFNTSTHIYRIAQEAINNAVKYSEANEIKLHLRTGNNQFIMSIEDQGKGFDLINTQPGMGLSIMKYRARMIQADLSIQSQPGEGTIVKCII